MMTIKITSNAILKSENTTSVINGGSSNSGHDHSPRGIERLNLCIYQCVSGIPGAKIAKMSYSTDHVAIKCGRKEDVVSAVSHSNLFHHSISPYTVGCGELPETFSGSFVSSGQSITAILCRQGKSIAVWEILVNNVKKIDRLKLRKLQDPRNVLQLVAKPYADRPKNLKASFRNWVIPHDCQEWKTIHRKDLQARQSILYVFWSSFQVHQVSTIIDTESS